MVRFARLSSLRAEDPVVLPTPLSPWPSRLRRLGSIGLPNLVCNLGLSVSMVGSVWQWLTRARREPVHSVSRRSVCVMLLLRVRCLVRCTVKLVVRVVLVRTNRAHNDKCMA